MQINTLFKHFDELQLKYGSNRLDAIYGAGQTKSPKLMLIFMNPTAKNVSSKKSWKSIKAPWLGTKNIWKMLFDLNLISKNIYNKIKNKKPNEWDYKFSLEVYSNIKNSSLYLTNLSKATQIDARHLPNKVFKEYLPLLLKEIEIIKPKAIITFGTQVSSIILNKQINLKFSRKKAKTININNKDYLIYPTYYPVGQGIRNKELAKEDINFILKTL